MSPPMGIFERLFCLGSLKCFGVFLVYQQAILPFGGGGGGGGGFCGGVGGGGGGGGGNLFQTE